MGMTLRDRILNKAVARRMTSPAATLVAGAAAAVPVAAGAPLALAAATGVAGWALVVAPEVLTRGSRKPAVDPSRLADPWAGFVREAQDAAARYDRAMRTVPDGALRERLVGIGERVNDGVHECFRIATRGAALDAASGSLEPHEQLLNRQAALDGRTDETAAQTRKALQAQLDAAERLAETRRQVFEKLHLLDARLNEAVARAVELGLSADELDHASAGRLGSDVEAVVGDMETLRQALEEASTLTFD